MFDYFSKKFSVNLRKKVLIKEFQLKTVSTTLDRLFRYNAFKDIDELLVAMFYAFTIHKAIDLTRGVNALEKTGQYRNTLILSRTLLDLNYRFLYLDKMGTSEILHFMKRTGVGNMKKTFDGKYKNVIEDLFEQEGEDLNKRKNIFSNLELVAININKEKNYNYHYGLYSRFAHTNPLVSMSYLNDLKSIRKMWQHDAGDYYKYNKRYLVMNNIYYYEILNKSLDFFIENNYIPHKDRIHKNFIKLCRDDLLRWKNIHKHMKKVSGNY